MSDVSPRGLPGGIPVPAVLFLSCAVFFVWAFTHPGIVDLGPHINPAGIAVIGGCATFLWLLVAIAKRPPPAAE